MSALTLRGHHRPHLTLGVAVPTLAVALLTVAAAAFASWRLDDGTTVTTEVDDVASGDAIGHWLETARDDVFPGADGPYLGECPTDAPGFTVGLCSRLTEDLGDGQIHLVGAYATDWGADVLLERGVDGWRVIDVAPWPQLGTVHFGPPWSPVTAIAAWWSQDAVPNVSERFGAGAVHLRSCAEARDVADADTGQPLLCSTLVEQPGAHQRVYTTGLVDAPAALRITVTEQPDHTWSVTEVVDLDAG